MMKARDTERDGKHVRGIDEVVLSALPTSTARARTPAASADRRPGVDREQGGLGTADADPAFKELRELTAAMMRFVARGWCRELVSPSAAACAAKLHLPVAILDRQDCA